MNFLNDPAYRGLREAMPALAVFGLVWWVIGSVPYFVARVRKAKARLAVRFLGITAIGLQGLGFSFIWGSLITGLETEGRRAAPDPLWWMAPFLTFGASLLVWVVAVTIGLMSEPQKPRGRIMAREAPAQPADHDFHITE